MDVSVSVEDLRSVPALADLGDAALAALAGAARLARHRAGEVIARAGEEARITYAVLAGSVVFEAQQDGRDQGSFAIPTGRVSGWLPRSRMTHAAWALPRLVRAIGSPGWIMRPQSRAHP